MRRREFIAAAGAAVAWPVSGFAQSARAAKLGVLVATPDPGPFLRSFRDGMQARGYDEGRNVTFEVRSANADLGRLASFAEELVRLKVDVIVAYQTPPAQAAKKATDTIPIVMAGVGDAVGAGLVAGLARPGGNVTGISSGAVEAGGKLVQILRDILPQAKRFATLCNGLDAGPNSFAASFNARIRQAGDAMAIAIDPHFVQGVAGLDAAFSALAQARVDAVIIQPGLGAKAPASLALRHRLAAASPNREFAVAGGLAAYSGKHEEYWHRAAVFVDEILKGANPADLPVEQPTTFDLVINLKTAKALNIAVPASLLATADEVIE